MSGSSPESRPENPTTSLPSLVIPLADEPIFSGVSAALAREGIQVGVTRANDQVDEDGQALDPKKEVRLAISGATTSAAPGAGDLEIFTEAARKVTDQMSSLPRSPSEHARDRFLDGAIHTATTGAGLKKQLKLQITETPKKLAALNEGARQLNILGEKLRRHKPR